MPTAAKLVSAILMAALGWYVSDLIRPLMPENTDFGWFNYVNAVIGLFCGWFVVGSRAGRGFSAGIGNGFTGAVALTFWGLFIHATNEMVDESFKRRYDSMIEAIGGVFEIMVEYGQVMLVPQVILALLAGGIAIGILTEIAAKRWR